MHHYAPLPEPLFGDVSPNDASLFARSAPSFRADVAIRTLDHLATPGNGDDRDRMATLAHLTSGDSKDVRDAVLATASLDPARTDALVRTYRAAPEDRRPALATTAGATLFLAGGRTAAVESILQHADRSGLHARMTELVELAMHHELNPHEIRGEMPSPVMAQTNTRTMCSRLLIGVGDLLGDRVSRARPWGYLTGPWLRT